MTVGELITQLSEYDKDTYVRIMNTEIDTDGECPTFELTSVEYASGLRREADIFNPNLDKDIIFLEFSDRNFVYEDCLITV